MIILRIPFTALLKKDQIMEDAMKQQKALQST